MCYELVRDIGSVFTVAARYEYVPVSSTPASMLVKAAKVNTEPTQVKSGDRRDVLFRFILL
jgi:hypothetical protein